MIEFYFLGISFISKRDMSNISRETQLFTKFGWRHSPLLSKILDQNIIIHTDKQVRCAHMKDTILVFVHIGPSQPKTLVHFAQQAIRNTSSLDLVLITNYPENWTDFPGKIISISKKYKRFFPLWWRAIHYDKMNSAKGYWKNTLLRLFVLGEVNYSTFPQDSMVIHIESDVLIMPCDATLSLLHSQIRKTSVVSLTPEQAIGAIVVFPNQAHLRDFVMQLKELLFSSFRWRSDMALLAEALTLDLCTKLQPIEFNGSQDNNRALMIFDGWPFGQFLFGQDPIHNNGLASGGYLSPYSPMNLQSGHWSIEELPGCHSHRHLFYHLDENLYLLFNLHVHSKVPIVQPHSEDNTWLMAMRAANGLQEFPRYRLNPSLEFHRDNGNFLSRCTRFLKSRFLESDSHS